MSEAKRAISFAVIVSVVCCVLITAASTGLKARQLRNMELDRQKNILKAADIGGDTQTMTPREVDTLFKTRILQVWAGQDGELYQKMPENEPNPLPLYLTLDRGDIISYIVPVDSRGLWGRIRGYMAIEADGSTIKGFTVYSHQETPGLGGEIESDWFQKNFVGKKIVAQSGDFASIKIAKGKAMGELDNVVDGISGATLTGRYLSEGIYEILTKYEPVSVRFREDRVNTHPVKR